MGAGRHRQDDACRRGRRATENVYRGRVVWTQRCVARTSRFGTLLDEIATQLGARRHTHARARTERGGGSRALVAAQPTLVVLDNFETIAADEQRAASTSSPRRACPALITTRHVSRAGDVLPTPRRRHVARRGATSFCNDSSSSTPHAQVYLRPAATATTSFAARSQPLVLQWVSAQIDLAQEPGDVLDDLARGRGRRRRARLQTLLQPAAAWATTGGPRCSPSRSSPRARRARRWRKSRASATTGSGWERGGRRTCRALWLVEATDRGTNASSVEGLTRELGEGARLSKDESRRRVPPTLRRLLSPPRRSARAADAGRLRPAGSGERQPVERHGRGLRPRRLGERRANGLCSGKPVSGMLSVRGYWDETLRVGDLALKAALLHRLKNRLRAWRITWPSCTRIVENWTRRGGSTARAWRSSKRLGNQSGIASTLHQLGRLAQDSGRGRRGAAALRRELGDYEAARQPERHRHHAAPVGAARASMRAS